MALIFTYTRCVPGIIRRYGILREVKCVNKALRIQSLGTRTECVSYLSSRKRNIRLSQKCQNLSTPAFAQNFHTSQITRNELRVVKCPQLAESLSEGDIRWEKAVGDTVAEDEIVCEVETDKTSVPVHAPAAGVIEELLVEDGATVQPGMDLFKLRVSGDATVAKPKEAAAAPPKEQPPESIPSPPPPSPVSAESPPAVKPTPSDGPIPSVPPPPPSVPVTPMVSVPTSTVKPAVADPSKITDSRSEQRVKMNRMRQRIAQRLKEAQNIYAMLTTFNEIDMSNIIEMRKLHKDAFLKKHGIKLGFMSAFVKASAYALKDQPIVNAVIDNLEIVHRDYIDISVAVATPKGLVVPVIRNVGNMNYADIEKAINALGEKARLGNLAIEDMDGGTFTISNGGVFGSVFGTPIINPPQSAILGMHAVVDRPVAINGKVEIRPMMYVALTYDHRLIDGREAVLFLRKIKATVEDPRMLLLDI
ncbi:dihydrolipoyllysine-residue succinyltransferase component of 2-oxoglutarate dehydrogenase complex, mitochondrial-like [Centruroides vittatus]|uniref:dihydrolipoyllysine-residue succinyltransferase component of 2-oxoglutarate dehydrogenase complex, mitochondrial-like n=1 Tax=Centruroides vittatus TaxID=120091 RepID=UPI00350EA4C7